MAVVSTPAVLLRSFAYGDTSRIIRFYTRDLGVVGVMAKGARKSGGKGRGAARTFSGGTLTVYVKGTRDLQTLKDFDVDRPRRGLARPLLRFAGASVVGEVVLRHSGEDANPRLFRYLEAALDGLEAVEEPGLLPTTLAAAWGAVGVLGYQPLLDVCPHCGEALEGAMGRFDFDAGGVRCQACGSGEAGPRVGPGARRQMADLLEGRVPEDLRRARAHLQLLSDFVTWHLSGGRPLESFRFLFGLLPEEGSLDD